MAPANRTRQKRRSGTDNDKKNRAETDTRDVYGRYLREIGDPSIALLTPAEEIELGRCMTGHIQDAIGRMAKAANNAKAILKKKRGTRPSDRSKAFQVLKQINPEGLDADKLKRDLAERMQTTQADKLFAAYALAEGLRDRDQFIKSNLKLVITIARQYRTRLISLEDLVQEGNLGLSHAVLTFDYRRGNRFSTYAVWWIRKAVTMAITNMGREIRIPAHGCEIATEAHHVRIDALAELGRKLTDIELATRLLGYQDIEQVPTRKLKAKLESIRHLDKMMQFSLSLDRAVRTDDGEGCPRYETVADEIDEPDTWESLIGPYGLEVLKSKLEELPTRDRMIIYRHFGFHGGKEWTRTELHIEYDISRERIRQILEHIYHKLRSHPPLRRRIAAAAA